MRVEQITAWVGSFPSLVFHTLLFAGVLVIGILDIIPLQTVLLVLTTIVSLEAIYLSIFIQITVNRNTASLEEVEENIDEIQEGVEELGEDVDEIQDDIEEMTEVEEVEKQKEQHHQITLEQLTTDVKRVLADLEALKKKQ